MSKTSKEAAIALLALLYLFNSIFNFQDSVFAESSPQQASIYDVTVDYPIATTRFLSHWTYSAEAPYTVCFWDKNDRYNLATYSMKKNNLTIYRFKDNLTELSSSITLSNPLSLFGDIVIDKKGNYYVMWGQNDTNKKNCVVTSLCKYDYNGKLLGKCEIKGYDSNPYIAWGQAGSNWGTQYPFHAGNCKLAISGNIITCNYARKMYSGHQSNFIIYANTSNMKRLYGNQNTPYTSHSFDQYALATSDNGFLYADHGDAYKRGFVLAKVNSSGSLMGEKITFHFREGSNRSYGYNETYAQFGGLAETSNAYVLCGSSEKTLSVEPAPTNEEYCGHSEARNLFVQILNKNFYSKNDSDMFLAKGIVRKVTGIKPTNAITPLKLNGNEVDYGVIWLTDLDADHYVCNPKVLSTTGSNFVVLWEELSYNDTNGDSYYMVLNESGQALVNKTKIPNTYLMGNTDLTYHNGYVYWTSSTGSKASTHKLDIMAPIGASASLSESNTVNSSVSTMDDSNSSSTEEAGTTNKTDESKTSGSKASGNNADGNKAEGDKAKSDSKSSKSPSTSIKKVLSKNDSLIIKVKKTKKTNGYQVQYSTKKSFKKAKKQSSKNTTIKIKNLKSKNTYFVRVRTYIKKGKQTVYGKWTKVEKIKIS